MGFWGFVMLVWAVWILVMCLQSLFRTKEETEERVLKTIKNTKYDISFPIAGSIAILFWVISGLMSLNAPMILWAVLEVLMSIKIVSKMYQIKKGGTYEYKSYNKILTLIDILYLLAFILKLLGLI